VSTLLGFGVAYRSIDFCEKFRRVVLLRKDISPRGHECFEHLIEGFGLVLRHSSPHPAGIPVPMCMIRQRGRASAGLAMPAMLPAGSGRGKRAVLQQ
jgi:hypothetical protein